MGSFHLQIRHSQCRLASLIFMTMGPMLAGIDILIKVIFRRFDLNSYFLILKSLDSKFHWKNGTCYVSEVAQYCTGTLFIWYILVCNQNQVSISGTKTNVHFLYRYQSWNFFIQNRNSLFSKFFKIYHGFLLF